jgi:crossover junction endodeoxyribonuclease RuvC
MNGARFRRQQPVGPFIVDFCSFQHRIVLEVDGGQHAARLDEDRARTIFLQRAGFHVLRFWNFEVFENLDAVLETIRVAIEASAAREARE